MANVAIRKSDGDKPASVRMREWQPLSPFGQSLRWDPFAVLMPAGWGAEPEAFMPEFDVKETADGFVFLADLPGVKDSDLEVRVAQNQLTIAGTRASELVDEGDAFYSYERSWGSFSRTFTLPEGVEVDEIEARLDRGVLTVELPKRTKPQPEQIRVESG